MVQATPFDLTLLTGETNEAIQDREIHYAQVLIWFTTLRDWFLHTNRRLSENPSLATHAEDHALSVRIPLTEQLFWQLCDTPPWSNVNRGSNLATLKSLVLAFLNREDCILELDDTEVETDQSYELLNVPNFLPRTLAVGLRENWVKTAGACGVARGMADPFICLEPIHAVWVISAQKQVSPLRITRRKLSNNEAQEEIILPILPSLDEWAWEKMVRASLWQDIRLPFNGPHQDGPFGYRPLSDWQPNQRPKTSRIQGTTGYKDALGGLWQWEGGRARTTSPFDGHWNVQLLNSAAKQNWRRWLEETYQQPVKLLSSHINIEPDGRIVDRTFDMG